MTSTPSASAAAAREAARSTTGQFGTQPHTEADLSLAYDVSADRIDTAKIDLTATRRVGEKPVWDLGGPRLSMHVDEIYGSTHADTTLTPGSGGRPVLRVANGNGEVMLELTAPTPAAAAAVLCDELDTFGRNAPVHRRYDAVTETDERYIWAGDAESHRDRRYRFTQHSDVAGVAAAEAGYASAISFARARVGDAQLTPELIDDAAAAVYRTVAARPPSEHFTRPEDWQLGRAVAVEQILDRGKHDISLTPLLHMVRNAARGGSGWDQVRFDVQGRTGRGHLRGDALPEADQLNNALEGEQS